MTPIEYLRHLQRETGIASSAIMKSIEQRSQQFDVKYLQRIINKFSLHTLEGQENFYRDNLIDPFLELLPDDAVKLLKDIYVGFLPTFDPNAWAIRIPDNGPLVVLHDELLAILSYYNELSFLAGRLLNNNRELGLNLLNEGNRFIVDCFREGRSRIFPALPPTLTKNEITMVAIKTMAQELFIILHEFAHIYLGHLDSNLNSFVGRGNNKLNINKFNRNQQQELDADVQAVIWLTNFKDKKTNSPFLRFASSSIGLTIEVFMLFHLVEVNLRFPMETLSHPSSIARLEYISKTCEHILSYEDNEFLKEMIVNAADTESFQIRQ